MKESSSAAHATRAARQIRSVSREEAVLLLNFGGPRTLGEVLVFLYEILRDPQTIQLPLPQWMQNLLARWVAKRRSVEVREQYAELGGHSPIVHATAHILRALAAALVQAGEPPRLIYPVHRYLPQHTARTVASLQRMGIRRIHALTMYPQYSRATTGGALEQLCAELRRAGWKGELSAQLSYADHPAYIAAMTERIQHSLAQINVKPEHTLLLCSAHGLPKLYVREGDPYLQEVRRSVAALRAQFSDWRMMLSFQSRLGPVEWLRPYTDQLIPELHAQGVRNLVFIPLSFVNDHIETLYEVGVTYFELARAHGLQPFRVPAVETHPRYIELLCDEVRKGFRGESGVPAEELLPPPPHLQRVMRWLCWGVCAGALCTAVLGALLWILIR